MLLRQLICASLFSTSGRSQSTESAGPRREKRMFGRVGSSRHSAVLRAQRDCVVVQRGVANAFCSVPVVDFTRAFYGIKIAVNPQQQPDQCLALRLVQAGEQAAFALERDRDDLVVGGKSLCGQRDRMGPSVLPIGPD